MSNTRYDMYQYFCSDSDHAVIYEFGSSWWISGWGDTIGIATGYGEYDEMYSRFQKLSQKAGCTIVNVSAAECEWAQKKR